MYLFYICFWSYIDAVQALSDRLVLGPLLRTQIHENRHSSLIRVESVWGSVSIVVSRTALFAAVQRLLGLWSCSSPGPSLPTSSIGACVSTLLGDGDDGFDGNNDDSSMTRRCTCPTRPVFAGSCQGSSRPCGSGACERCVRLYERASIIVALRARSREDRPKTKEPAFAAGLSACVGWSCEGAAPIGPTTTSLNLRNACKSAASEHGDDDG